jgi:hypothetical protein
MERTPGTRGNARVTRAGLREAPSRRCGYQPSCSLRASILAREREGKEKSVNRPKIAKKYYLSAKGTHAHCSTRGMQEPSHTSLRQRMPQASQIPQRGRPGSSITRGRERARGSGSSLSGAAPRSLRAESVVRWTRRTAESLTLCSLDTNYIHYVGCRVNSVKRTSARQVDPHPS